jgi:pimeloyl-ACP methyl ester carboxylesterase
MVGGSVLWTLPATSQQTLPQRMVWSPEPRRGLGSGRRYWAVGKKTFRLDFRTADDWSLRIPTLLGRVKFWKSVSLSDEAEAFADIIRDIDQYQTIFLVGHSEGGLLCMAAMAHLIDSRQQAVLSRIKGLILMATPQTGSQRVPTLLSWMSKDFNALKPHGAFVTDLQNTFVNTE